MERWRWLRTTTSPPTPPTPIPNPTPADPLYNEWVIIVFANVLIPNSTRPSACTVLTKNLNCVFPNFHWSPTVPVSVWLPEPARDRGSKQETLNNDFYHTTSRSSAIFGVQGGRSYLVLALTLWIGLCPMKRSSGVWNFGDVSVTYRRSFGNHTLAGPYVPVTYYRNRL